MVIEYKKYKIIVHQYCFELLFEKDGVETSDGTYKNLDDALHRIIHLDTYMRTQEEVKLRQYILNYKRQVDELNKEIKTGIRIPVNFD